MKCEFCQDVIDQTEADRGNEVAEKLLGPGKVSFTCCYRCAFTIPTPDDESPYEEKWAEAMADLTHVCDHGSCECETDCLHERGCGVFCDEHAAKRIKNSFDPEAEENDQDETRAAQEKLYGSIEIDSFSHGK